MAAIELTTLLHPGDGSISFTVFKQKLQNMLSIASAHNIAHLIQIEYIYKISSHEINIQQKYFTICNTKRQQISDITFAAPLLYQHGLLKEVLWNSINTNSPGSLS